MSKVMSMQTPQLQDKLIIVVQTETKMIGMSCLHSKITAVTTASYFVAFFG